MKQFHYVIAVLLAAAAVGIYTGKIEMSTGTMALYILIDAISIAIRAHQESKNEVRNKP